MAWFVNMTIKCDEKEAAEKIAGAYKDGKVVTSKHEIDLCKVDAYFVNDLWYVYIEPRGLGWNEGPRNDELTTPESMKEIREKLFDTLKSCSGYRRAIFDIEANDSLTYREDPSEIHEYDWPNMVVSEHLIEDMDLKRKMSEFSNGYLRNPPQ